MAQTTSTGAKKIQDSDNWRDIFADHNDTVDAYDGVITGTVSVITGTTNNTGHTIAAGEYFIANGSKYKATASIPSNTAWASSATAVSDIDIINSLNSAIKTVSTNLGSASSASSVTGADAFSKIDVLNSKLTSNLITDFIDVPYTIAGNNRANFNLYTLANNKPGYVPLGTIGYATNNANIFVLNCFAGISNAYGLYLINISASQITGTCSVAILYKEVS